MSGSLYGSWLLIWLQAGLFAAFLSAFLIFTITQLQPSSNDIAVGVLIHISQQLNNATVPAYATPEFTVSSKVAAVNVGFFLSLALVLVDAFLAMLIKSCLREFERGWKKYNAAHLRAQERERLVQRLERWGLPAIVALLPIFMQLSLLFFCIGLLILVFPVHPPSTLAASIVPLFFTTFIFILNFCGPFPTPITRTFATLISGLRTARILQGSFVDHSLETTQSLPMNVVAHPAQPQSRGGIENKAVVTYSRHQIDPQAHVDVLERLVMTTAEAVENIPIFLELLDQPVKDLTLWPFNVEKWKQLLHITLRLLGDPSTFSVSVACTIARTMLFCYDHETVDQRLYQRLQRCFNIKGSDETGTRKSFEILFSSHLHFRYYDRLFVGVNHWRTMCETIAHLEPSSTVDAELLWMVNTISRIGRWSQAEYLEYFAAVLTYVASTEQSRRSQVPLTAAVIYAMHTIKSAYGQNSIGSIPRLYILPMSILTSELVPTAFHKVKSIDALDLWNDECVGFASALLQPHDNWSEPWDSHVRMFQLPLIAALYVDSTEQARDTCSPFAEILRLLDITNITLDSWGWVNAYDPAKLAGYWHMALFQQPLYQKGIQNAPFQDIGYVIMQTIMRCSELMPSESKLSELKLSELRLSELDLLETSVKHLRATSLSSPILLVRDDDNLRLSYTLPDGPTSYYANGPFNSWIMVHLDTLLAHRCTLHPKELEELEYIDTAEQVHIAKARLALYDSLEEDEHNGTRKFEPDPVLLKKFLWSKDYDVCVGAFKCCLCLVAISQLNDVDNTDSTSMFVPDMLGCEWIEHLIQGLCAYDRIRSWAFLAENLIPKWTILPPSWRYDFASVLLSSNAQLPDGLELPAYQCFAESSEDINEQNDHLNAYLSLLSTMLELFRSNLDWDRLVSMERWLANLPEILETQQSQANIKDILTIRKQQLEREAAEAMEFFTSLPMAASAMDE